jgi:hypothetical protein
MQPDPDRAAYASYLLRLRRAWRDGEPVCQAMLIDVRSKEQRCFPDLDRLFAYLHEQGASFEAESAQQCAVAET